MAYSSASMTAEITRWLGELSGAGGPFELTPIAGGASPRRFYRARSRNAVTGALFDASAIVMVVPPETPDVAFASARGRGWPFLEVRGLLEANGVRVPRLYAEACDRGLLLVEDLGETLAEHLVAHPGERDELYRSAVLDLSQAQAALEPLPEGSIVKERAFDRELLGLEVDHFREWGLEARGVALTSAERATFDAARDFLVETLAALPRGFVHRDYQSRNLLVTTGDDRAARRLGWIDFQDALLGPRAYDLVALLCDSYQPFECAFVDRRLDDYASARGLSTEARRTLGREFDLITVQRKLKDAGRFVFIERKKGDPSFLPFFEPTVAIARQALERLSDVAELSALRALLDARVSPSAAGRR